MAKFQTVTVERSGVQRLAETPADLVAFEWDGWVQIDTKNAGPAATPEQAGGRESRGGDGTKTAGTNKN